MAGIDYYFSTLSPFSYLAGGRLEQIADRRGVGVTYRPLDIMALMPRTGGLAPKDRHASRMEYRAQELQRQADKVGMVLNMAPAHWPTNAAPSSYAIIAAQNAGSGAGGGDVGALAQAFLRACWTEDRDIARDEVVRACLEETGFDPGLADSGLLVGAETYAANLEQAVKCGVFGAPFYITADDQRFWGQDRLEDLERHLAGIAT